jgi:hypothetical protein
MTTQIEGIIESLEELLNYDIIEEIKKNFYLLKKNNINSPK